ncbi:prenyltransferase/squalene oxidase repeat-containing protein, partial [Streptomyces sp. CC77]|uniref:prenyltransferase/squalene oxidase repeat-containing protein n=1 Tax=Streptomyces sp. CC77 TaxID=1906739 RepID=UPI000A8F63AF
MTATTDGSAGATRPRTAPAAEADDTTSTPRPTGDPALPPAPRDLGPARGGTVGAPATDLPPDPPPAGPTRTARGERPARAAGSADGGTRTGEPDRATAADVRPAAAPAVRRATAHLLALQDPEGWWKGDLETNVTMDAEDLLLREFLGVRDGPTTAAAARWIRSRQREDGTWATFHGGPGELSATVEAYVALRLAGDPPDAPHMARAAAWVRDRGGIAATRVFTRIWLALFGWWKWDDLPELPPELIYLPPWFPLNIYDFGQWARQTIVPLTIVSAKRPVRPAP